MNLEQGLENYFKNDYFHQKTQPSSGQKRFFLLISLICPQSLYQEQLRNRN